MRNSDCLPADHCPLEYDPQFALPSLHRIGAYTGVSLSNTFALETCFNWTGVLIEANPRNFQKLQRSGRKAQMVHSAVCANEGTTRMTVAGDMTAGEYGAMSPEYLRRWGRGNGAAKNESVVVPCKPLKSIVESAGFNSIDFLSLDVEGAEEIVLRTADPSMFGLVMVEADATDKAKDARVVDYGLAGGLRLSQHVKVRASDIMLRSDVQETLVHEIPKGFIGPLNGFKIFKFQPSQERLTSEIKNARHSHTTMKLMDAT